MFRAFGANDLPLILLIGSQVSSNAVGGAINGVPDIPGGGRFEGGDVAECLVNVRLELGALFSAGLKFLQVLHDGPLDEFRIVGFLFPDLVSNDARNEADADTKGGKQGG